MQGESPGHGHVAASATNTRVGLSLLLVLFGAGPLLPAPWLWGVNHASWLHPAVWVAFPIAGLVLVWTPVGTRFGSWLQDRLAPALFGRTWLLYGLVPVVGGIVFWLLRERTHMLGDGQTLAVMLDDGKLFHGFDFMTYHLLARIHQVSGGAGEESAFRAGAVVASLAGAGWLAAAGWTSRRLADQPGPRLLIYTLLVCGSPLLLFFGYMEVYAPLAVALLVFVTSFILYREGRGSLTTVAGAWSVGLFFHLNALFLAPLLVCALLRRPADQGPGFPRRLLTLVWPPLVALATAGIILAAAGYDLARLREEFGQAGQGTGILVAISGAEGLFTWRHFKDGLNLLLLLAGVPVVLILAHLRSVPGRMAPAGLRTDLLLTSGWLVLLMFLLNLKLGAVRDWDLFAPQACLLAVTGWYLAAGGRSASSVVNNLLGPVTAVLLVLTLPWQAVNLTAEKALARLEGTAADMSPYALGLLHEQFAYHHQLAGDGEAVLRHYRRCGEVCPTHPRFHAIYGTHLLNEGHLDEAAAAYDRAVAADSTYVYGLKMGLLARVLNADYAGALEPARTLERRGQQDAEACAAHGMAAQQLGLAEEAEQAYLRGYAIDPNRLDLLERAAGLRLVAGRYPQAEEAFRQVLAARPDHGQAALGLADAIWQDYLANGKSRTFAVNEARLTETVALVEKVLNSGQVDRTQAASLRAWTDQMRSALVSLVGE